MMSLSPEARKDVKACDVALQNFPGAMGVIFMGGNPMDHGSVRAAAANGPVDNHKGFMGRLLT